MIPELAPMDVAARAPRLRERVVDAGCEALLVNRMVNIRYLTGFTGSAGLLLVLPDEVRLVTDGRYGEQAAEQLARAGVDAAVEVGRTQAAQRDLVTEAAGGVARLGLEAASVTWAQQRAYAADWFPRAELVPTEGLVEGLRQVKDAGEVARIGAAAAVADAALAAVRPRLLEGLTEAEVALELDSEMRRRGAAGPGFETICASGPNGSRPHHRPSQRRLREGDLVVLDFGAVVDGYTSDMTRTFCLGPPDDTQRRMLDAVTAAHAAGVSAVAPGVEAQAVDAACRGVIEGAGWGEAFLHGTGHGLGLEIHEDPRVGPTSAASLTVGHVVTVEPGVYLPEHGGVRVEDSVVVTPEGCQPLTLAPKGAVLT